MAQRMNLTHFFQKLARSIRKRVPFLRSKRSATARPTLAALLGRPKLTETPATQMLDVASLLRAHGITPRGVIHVGAHVAGELDDYLRMGFSKIVYIEANPALIPGLRAKAEAHGGKVIIVHAAASDTDGTVRLRVTSMDQSSSILPLAKHKDIYPSIREVSQVEVRGRRLDTLLTEEGLSAEDFNFLNLDIQGAELMALRGAPNLLSGIEAVNTEVNLQELYQGAGLLGELEQFMAKLGFGRAAMVTPWHPSWGDAFYVRKPVVTMTTLGSNGRFANQLFQYMFLQLVARRQGALVQSPGWVGCELFGRTDPEPLLALPEWRESLDGTNGQAVLLGCEWTKHFKEKNPAFASTDYWGYFMGHSRDLAPDRDHIRELFHFQPEFVEFAESLLARIRTGRRILAVHLRRGDYGYGYFFRAPCAWYEVWLKDAGLDPSEWVIFLCSETPTDYRGRFPEFKKADSDELGMHGVLAAYLDFYVMTKADKVLTANSSFSIMASMLNENGSEFLRPCAETERLVRFDPWDTDVLLRFTPTPETHQRFIDQD
jgi:FkbM family methyltransferase